MSSAKAQTELQRARSRSQQEAQGRQTPVSTRFVLGAISWSETVNATRTDGRTYDVRSAMRGVELGAQWRVPATRRWGYLIDAGALLARANSDSRDASLVYEQSNALAYGAVTGIGLYRQIDRARVAGSFFARWRHVDYREPSGFSFSDSKDRLAYLLKLEVSFPIWQRVDFVQQLGAAPGTQGAFWLVGLRI